MDREEPDAGPQDWRIMGRGLLNVKTGHGWTFDYHSLTWRDNGLYMTPEQIAEDEGRGVIFQPTEKHHA